MSQAKAPRRDFALPRAKKFPMNTPERRKIAPGMARYALRKGTISHAQYRKVLRASRSRGR